MTAARFVAIVIGAIAANHRPAPPLEHEALASWYDQDGPGGCNVAGGVQRGLRFASLILPCGTRVRFCMSGRCRTATMSDHGPYITGRTFDMNNNLAAALRCSGVCWVRWNLA